MKPMYLKSLLLALVGLALVVTFRPASEPAAADEPADMAIVNWTWPEVARLRTLAKDRLAREVAAGCRPLLEAATLFRELDGLPPIVPDLRSDVRPDAAIPFPGRNDHERRCQQVLLHVRAAFGDSPAMRQEAEQRIAAEFSRILRECGTIRLPDAASLESVHDVLLRTRAGLTEKERRDLFGHPTAGR